MDLIDSVDKAINAIPYVFIAVVVEFLDIL